MWITFNDTIKKFRAMLKERGEVMPGLCLQLDEGIIFIGEPEHLSTGVWYNDDYAEDYDRVIRYRRVFKPRKRREIPLYGTFENPSYGVPTDPAKRIKDCFCYYIDGNSWIYNLLAEYEKEEKK